MRCERTGERNSFGQVSGREGNGGFCDGHGFLSAVIVEGEPKLISGKRCVDRIAQREILGVALRMMFRDRHCVSPHGDPFCIVHDDHSFFCNQFAGCGRYPRHSHVLYTISD